MCASMGGIELVVSRQSAWPVTQLAYAAAAANQEM